ncbi:hypothetical protein V2I01_42365 [Micromonospora sp. BRA006-A]|nr:hypothetical protein [Micromonospora sp. BRA006-A]
MWLSISPGSTAIPPRSTRRAPPPARSRHSARSPTATIRSPRTSIASAYGRSGSRVWMRAFS